MIMAATNQTGRIKFSCGDLFVMVGQQGPTISILEVVGCSRKSYCNPQILPHVLAGLSQNNGR